MYRLEQYPVDRLLYTQTHFIWEKRAMCEQEPRPETDPRQQNLFDTEEDAAQKREDEFRRASRWACYDG